MAISATAADWERERPRRLWDPSRRILASIRGYQRWKRKGVLGRVISRFYALEHRLWSTVAGAEIPLHAAIGGGLMIPHPNGIVIHPDVKIGVNCMIFQQVTIGASGSVAGVPEIGGHVDIGAGAKVLGPVKIGDHARIGANAVVLEDVPAGATAVGIPARILQKKPANTIENAITLNI